jgi:hypothetical protein
VSDNRALFRWLAAMRIGTGIIFLLRTTPLLAPFRIEFLQHTFPLFGWPDGSFRAPLWGLGLPDGLVVALCMARTLAALGFTLGLFSRVCGIAAGLLGYLVLAQDEFTYVQTLHLIFGSTCLLGLTDCGSMLALRPDRPRSPNSSLWLMQVWVVSVYAWAGLAKLHADWLDGRALGLFQQAGAIRGPLPDMLLSTPALRAWVARGIAGVEIGLGPALLLGRTRKTALVIAYGLHLGIQLAAHPDMFSLQMGVLLLSFLPPVAAASLELNRRILLLRMAIPSTPARTSHLLFRAPEVRIHLRHCARHMSFQWNPPR